MLSDMPKMAILIGTLLILLAVIGYLVGYFGSEYASWTALIPAFAGVPILICGLIALRGPTARKHAMHVAALFGLLGAVAPLGRLPATFRSEEPNLIALTSMIGMIILCALLVVLAVRSFIAARRATP